MNWGNFKLKYLVLHFIYTTIFIVMEFSLKDATHPCVGGIVVSVLQVYIIY